MFNYPKHLLLSNISSPGNQICGVSFKACFPGTALTGQLHRRMREYVPLFYYHQNQIYYLVCTKPVVSVFHVLWLATQTRETSAFRLPTLFIQAKGSIWWWLSTGDAVVSEVCNVCTEAITSVSETSGSCSLARQISTTAFLPLMNDMIVAVNNLHII